MNLCWVFLFLFHFLAGEGRINLFAEQFLFPLPAHVRQALIDGYYELDGPFVKEILGKKLTSNMRKNLDEISEEIAIPVVSCRRQVNILSALLCSDPTQITSNYLL